MNGRVLSRQIDFSGKNSDKLIIQPAYILGILGTHERLSCFCNDIVANDEDTDFACPGKLDIQVVTVCLVGLVVELMFIDLNSWGIVSEHRRVESGSAFGFRVITEIRLFNVLTELLQCP